MEDEERFTEVFRSTYAWVFAYVRRRIAKEHANDVVAETFMAAWRHLDKLPPDPLPWLYRAASFEIANLSRKLGREDSALHLFVVGATRTARADPADEVVKASEWLKAFASLSESDREVLALVAWEDLDPASAARVLGCSVVSFKVRVHRARRRLVARLESETPAFMRGEDRRRVPRTDADGSPQVSRASRRS